MRSPSIFGFSVHPCCGVSALAVNEIVPNPLHEPQVGLGVALIQVCLLSVDCDASLAVLSCSIISSSS